MVDKSILMLLYGVSSQVAKYFANIAATMAPPEHPDTNLGSLFKSNRFTRIPMWKRAKVPPPERVMAVLPNFS